VAPSPSTCRATPRPNERSVFRTGKSLPEFSEKIESSEGVGLFGWSDREGGAGATGCATGSGPERHVQECNHVANKVQK